MVNPVSWAQPGPGPGTAPGTWGVLNGIWLRGPAEVCRSLLTKIRENRNQKGKILDEIRLENILCRYRLDNNGPDKWKTKLIQNTQWKMWQLFRHLGFCRTGIKVQEEILMKASSSDFFVRWKPTEIDIKKLLSLIQSRVGCRCGVGDDAFRLIFNILMQAMYFDRLWSMNWIWIYE